MFQDIAPHTLNIGYKNRRAEDQDYLVSYLDNKVFTYEKDGFILPVISVVRQADKLDINQLIYLFDIDGKGFYLSPDKLSQTDELKYQDVRIFRDKQPEWLSFAGATAVHLARWYENNLFCGRCSASMLPKEGERALICPDCGFVSYPRINPVVMVGIKKDEKLLLTRYAHSDYKNYSLIAGFMEIGETLEDAVKREVMEEVGLKVKNIRYYKSQPWAFSESILVGFFADVDGNEEPFPDGEELSEALWFSRDEIPVGNSTFSLTWDMIEQFRQGIVQ